MRSSTANAVSTFQLICHSLEGQIGHVAYAASKGGIVGLTLAAARDLASLAIRVRSIAPGAFQTSLTDSFEAVVQHSLLEAVPFRQRLRHPKEFASLLVATVSTKMHNGETIRLDGALRMPPR
jgi:3-hydroxyacyl-CoA dehydrogenase/3-hydroxy-2-methylbutyryl-CoA dehydrogenase